MNFLIAHIATSNWKIVEFANSESGLFLHLRERRMQTDSIRDDAKLFAIELQLIAARSYS